MAQTATQPASTAPVAPPAGERIPPVQEVSEVQDKRSVVHLVDVYISFLFS